ncbi:hypothetical protein TEA_006833 [Camellia sinensis var. sinensis]|uniref:Pentacotripeptide-repeat region of PRORP domain-containing protein n=1 Tax=Camellia sinensis var. sinensis TaxID=542762 RepID=A0A4S4ELF1_CAMSN|nr:hypothetical protein TEA_006833 [Camellia sinensis var. sinensis]
MKPLSIPNLLSACKSIRNLEQVHTQIIHKGAEQDHFVITRFISLCTSLFSNISYASSVFDRVLQPNIYLWNTLIKGYCKHSSLAQCISVFLRMKQSGNVVPDEYTFPSLLKACSSELALKEGQAIHGLIVRYGTEHDVFVGSSLVDLYGKCREIEFARKVFDGMCVRNEVSWTSMIVGYVNAGDLIEAKKLFDVMPKRNMNGQPNEAVEIFLKMQSMNIKPDEFIVVSLMSACSQIGSLEQAKWVDSYVSQSSLDLHQVHVLAALIDMNAKCGNMGRATMLFEKMPKRDLVCFCSMIQGLSIHGHGVQAVSLFRRMINEGITPDDVAFTVILNACSHAGLVEEGCRFFDSMINEYSLVPSTYHYACMVDLLGRSGKLRAAYELLKSMLVEPHAGAWGALLGACKLHNDIELGEEIAAQLFEIEPHNACSYVLLSDIYAAADRWLDVSFLRSQMIEMGVKKKPGRSLIYSAKPSVWYPYESVQ